MLDTMADDHYRDFPLDERPAIDVLVDGTWYAGELRSWSQPFPSGDWWASVGFRISTTLHVRTVRSSQVRPTATPVA
jgi:hypothetical protein